MSPWLIPIGVELCAAVILCGALVLVRSSIGLRGLALWAALWAVRGAGSMALLHSLAKSDLAALLAFAPLEIGFALALAVVLVQMEKQKQRIRGLGEQLSSVRQQQAGRDALTGLLNRSALAKWIEETRDFDGLVVVCDMDDFKPLNDRYGHLAGDEILHGAGHLIRNSIREEDHAFRWGGDEFVIFFDSLDREMVESRMRAIEDRLAVFRLRQHETIAVHMSWGIASASGRTIRDAVAEADRLMYEVKRSRRAQISNDAIAGE